MAVIAVNSENFEQEVLKNEKTVLVDFWASWCGPCRMLSPVVEQLAEEYEGKVKVGKVNVDEEGELASAFQVMSIPCIVVMKDGKIVEKAVGYRPKAQLEEMLR